MPKVKRPDGPEIEWREHGEGPLVIVTRFAQAPPVTTEDLVEELSRDHRVIDYDTRGTGGSTREGPYEIPVDAEDTVAVLEDVGAGPAVAVALGDGCNRAVRAAAARPDLISAVVVSGQVPFGPVPEEGASEGLPDALALSTSVFDGLIQMYETDFRAAVHSVITTADPGLAEEKVRERVNATADYCGVEAMTTRLRSWRADDAQAKAASLGDRLWILSYEGNPFFPLEFVDQMREELPGAHFEQVEDGAINRPELTAAYVRQLTRATAPSGGRS